jgi:hypothetical protein
MRKFLLALSCTAMVAPTVMMPTQAAAQRHHRGDRYSDNNYREWRGNDGRLRCRRSNGTTGLVVGGVAGALLGRTIDTRGDRALGTLGGAAAGALAGRAIDRGGSNGRRCR